MTSFPCSLCQGDFETESALGRHLVDEHEEVDDDEWSDVDDDDDNDANGGGDEDEDEDEEEDEEYFDFDEEEEEYEEEEEDSDSDDDNGGKTKKTNPWVRSNPWAVPQPSAPPSDSLAALQQNFRAAATTNPTSSAAFTPAGASLWESAKPAPAPSAAASSASSSASDLTAALNAAVDAAVRFIDEATEAPRGCVLPTVNDGAANPSGQKSAAVLLETLPCFGDFTQLDGGRFRCACKHEFESADAINVHRHAKHIERAAGGSVSDAVRAREKWTRDHSSDSPRFTADFSSFLARNMRSTLFARFGLYGMQCCFNKVSE